MTDRVERFFFVHVQKTAGTSLIMRLRRHFDRRAIYPDPTDGDAIERVISVDNLLARWRARAEEIRVVTGHFPMCTTDVLGGGFTTLTLLREPLERTLSYLRHHRKTTPEARDLPLEAVYDDQLRFHGLVHNHMVKMFSLLPDEMTAGVLTPVDFTPERLERAKERLAAVDALGLQELFEEFCEELSERFGWRLGDPLHANRTRPCDASRELRARILEDNAMDVDLYDFARDLVAERRSRTP